MFRIGNNSPAGKLEIRTDSSTINGVALRESSTDPTSDFITEELSIQTVILLPLGSFKIQAQETISMLYDSADQQQTIATQIYMVQIMD